MPSHASLPLEDISMRLREGGARQRSLIEVGLTEAEVWWHFCTRSKEREYRANGWPCSQCGARGADGESALFAFATGFAAMPRSRA